MPILGTISLLSTKWNGSKWKTRLWTYLPVSQLGDSATDMLTEILGSLLFKSGMLYLEMVMT